MWVTSTLSCGSVGQMGQEVQPTFNPDTHTRMLTLETIHFCVHLVSKSISIATYFRLELTVKLCSYCTFSTYS